MKIYLKNPKQHAQFLLLKLWNIVYLNALYTPKGREPNFSLVMNENQTPQDAQKAIEARSGYIDYFGNVAVKASFAINPIDLSQYSDENGISDEDKQEIKNYVENLNKVAAMAPTPTTAPPTGSVSLFAAPASSDVPTAAFAAPASSDVPTAASRELGNR